MASGSSWVSVAIELAIFELVAVGRQTMKVRSMS
jgi:hypothetical protein